VFPGQKRLDRGRLEQSCLPTSTADLAVMESAGVVRTLAEPKSDGHLRASARDASRSKAALPGHQVG